MANSGTLKLGKKSKDHYSLQIISGKNTLEAENKNEMVL